MTVINNNLKEVYFDHFCNKCKHFDKPGFKDPCNECLENFANEGSHKPIKFEKKDK